ncbi:hypothetical protein K435DRAFT_794585 [Dendrothele bispora CBS 962.96]|uniref:Uncharacterized protein n=1 Tax=Dendrothele bispora (strain CBS 962.96) TaxID=1314807 RepID=A0A4V4HGR1_DENBC|nr:hypothetical protein K435DRAFT_794585 [Dendrothele bispora CBS 962.96]
MKIRIDVFVPHTAPYPTTPSQVQVQQFYAIQLPSKAGQKDREFLGEKMEGDELKLIRLSADGTRGRGERYESGNQCQSKRTAERVNSKNETYMYPMKIRIDVFVPYNAPYLTTPIHFPIRVLNLLFRKSSTRVHVDEIETTDMGGGSSDRIRFRVGAFWGGRQRTGSGGRGRGLCGGPATANDLSKAQSRLHLVFPWDTNVHASFNNGNVSQTCPSVDKTWESTRGKTKVSVLVAAAVPGSMGITVGDGS